MINESRVELGLPKSRTASQSNLIIEVEKGAGFWSSYLNLVKSIMGAGMLSLPFALSIVGLLPGLTMLAIATAMSTFGIYLLVISLQGAGRSASFGSLAMMTYPRIALFFEAVVVVKCLGVLVSYLGIASNFIPAIIASLFPGAPSLLLSQRTWCLLVAALISPITFMPRIDSLKYTSFLGLLSIAYITTLAVVMYFLDGLNMNRIYLFAPFKLASFRAFSIFVFALTCHQNIPAIQNEAKDQRPSAMMGIVSAGVGTAVAIYLIFALATFALFGNTSPDNAINAFPKTSVPFILARLLYAFLMIFSLPLQTYPCRTAGIRFAELVSPSFSQSNSRRLFWIISASILAFTTLLSLLNLPLGLMLGFVGGTTGPIICFILPGLIHNKLCQQAGTWPRTRIAALTLVALGIFVMAISVTSQVYSALGKL